ncbi:hypothetical protein VNO78_03233 [Psophocarpus tetragonolobus]|uniref:Reverse transcriptase domain-containing protein n=1 Tax=Psophocarpus tetragonolobus TaxID=3891 RepID=A0AAN9T3Y0_PSOTE
MPGYTCEDGMCAIGIEINTSICSVSSVSSSISGADSNLSIVAVEASPPPLLELKPLILLEDESKLVRQPQRRLNPTILDVVNKEVTKLLMAGIIYPISDSIWVSPVHIVLKKFGTTVVQNQENELIPTRVANKWRVCIDYRQLNQATRKDHFPILFIDQVIERLVGKSHYCFLDGFSGYMQIHISPKDQHKTTFTCPFGTFAYTRMPFGLYGWRQKPTEQMILS